jgi:hypothetical protein
MLPANMFGETRLNTFGCVTRSPCSRSSGMPIFHAVSPTFRYDTATCALRLVSPSIGHSNPRLISVGGSTTSSPAVTELVAPGVACFATPVTLHSSAMQTTSTWLPPPDVLGFG